MSERKKVTDTVTEAEVRDALRFISESTAASKAGLMEPEAARVLGQFIRQQFSGKDFAGILMGSCAIGMVIGYQRGIGPLPKIEVAS